MKTDQNKRSQQLIDRRAYRQTLIHRREELELKIARVEEQIRDLQK